MTDPFNQGTPLGLAMLTFHATIEVVQNNWSKPP